MKTHLLSLHLDVDPALIRDADVLPLVQATLAQLEARGISCGVALHQYRTETGGKCPAVNLDAEDQTHE